MSTIVIAIKEGAPKQSVELADNATVAQLREKLSASGLLASVNGDSVSDETELADGDVVTFTGQVKGA